MAFKGTKLSHARFVVGPFSADTMSTLGGVLKGSIYGRIARGQTVNDAPAKPLSSKYAKTKTSKGRAGIRDWMFQLQTLNHMNVLRANENRAVIGFDHPLAALHARWQNLRERQFGVSPKDNSVIAAAVHAAASHGGIVTVKRAA